MHGFRQAAHRTLSFSKDAFNHTRQKIVQVDRGINRALRLYSQVAPILAPVATKTMGFDRAKHTHDSIQKFAQGYGDLRERVVEGHRMGSALAHALKKEGVSI